MNKIILIVFGILFISCHSIKQNQTNDDYILLNKILTTSDGAMVLDKNNSNIYVVSVLKRLKKYDIINNSVKHDSLKSDLGISNDLFFDSIFNIHQYDYLISQAAIQSKWDMDIVSRKVPMSDHKNYSSTITVSKPIYTKNKKTALVYYSKPTSSAILIFKKENGKWKEYKLIAPMLF